MPKCSPSSSSCPPPLKRACQKIAPPPHHRPRNGPLHHLRLPHLRQSPLDHRNNLHRHLRHHRRSGRNRLHRNQTHQYPPRPRRPPPRNKSEVKSQFLGTLHIATITNLRPSLFYRYKNHLRPGWQNHFLGEAPGEFRTAPPPDSTEPIRLAVYGDTPLFPRPPPRRLHRHRS